MQLQAVPFAYTYVGVPRAGMASLPYWLDLGAPMEVLPWAVVIAGLGLLVGILVALAASGIYAMMSFSVSERTREIGIRTALGASRRELVLTIMRRSLVQLGVGGLLGIPLATWLVGQIADDGAGVAATGGAVLVSIGLALGVVALVAVLSCAAPTRRALGIEANEALRAEG